jgi:hypothetical protein
MTRTAQPDSPVVPDVVVAPDLDAVARGEDPDLARVRAMADQKR